MYQLLHWPSNSRFFSLLEHCYHCNYTSGCQLLVFCRWITGSPRSTRAGFVVHQPHKVRDKSIRGRFWQRGATAVSIRGGFDKSSSPPLLAPVDLGRLFRFGMGHWVERNLLPPVIPLTSRHSRISFRSFRVSPLDSIVSILFSLFPGEIRTDWPGL